MMSAHSTTGPMYCRNVIPPGAETIEQGAKAIFTRQLRDFYLQSWKSCSSLTLRGNPVSNDKLYTLCSGIFDGVKRFVSLRVALHSIQFRL